MDIVNELRALIGEAGVLDATEVAKRSAGVCARTTSRPRRWLGLPAPRKSPP